MLLTLTSIKAMTLLINPLDSIFDSVGLKPRQKTRKVLHVVNGQHYAGAARVQDLLALSLPNFGYDVSFACVFPDKFESKRQSQNSPLFNFPMKHRLDLAPAKRIAKLVTEQGYDLIHSHTTRSSLIGSTAARMAGVPYIHHVHCQMDTEVGQRVRSFINKQLEKRACRRADRIIAVSDSVKRFLLRNHFSGTPISVVPNGVPSPSLKKSLRTAGQPWVIGMVALLRERKGLETLIQALPELSAGFDVRLRIVGSFVTDEYRLAMLKLADHLGIASQIDWTGFTSDVNSEVCRMDVLVLPSVLPEGMPMVLLEAMAAGVPIVGSRVDGITDVIRHEKNGLLAEPADARSLATQLGRIFSGQKNWIRLHEECLADYEAKFSDKAMAAAVADVYSSVLGDDRDSGSPEIKSTSNTHSETCGEDQPANFLQVPQDLQTASPMLRRFHTWKASAAVKACVPFSRLLPAPQAAKPGILMYHRVVPCDKVSSGIELPSWNVTPQQFREQLTGLLASGYQPWSLSRLVETATAGEHIPDNVFVITFDDGYANNCTHALPILKELKVPATIFLATNYIDSAEPFPFDDWSRKGLSAEHPDTWRALTMDECHQLLDSGVIEFGSHTHTHEDFRNRPEAFRTSLRASMDFLQSEFGITKPTLSLPYGIVRDGFAGPTYFATAKAEGAICCLTTEEELLDPASSPFGWGRFIAEDRDSASMLAVKLDGWRDAARDTWRRVRGK